MTSQKSRLLFLLELLNRETDEQHPITIAKIMTRLNAEGFTATRKTVTKDIDTLLAHGIDVVCNKGKQNQYFIGGREFELPELTMLVDAVQAAKFIPVRQSQTLIEKLSKFVSIYQADRLNRQLYVHKQVKSANDKVMYVVDLLQTAIQQKQQVKFKYVEYTPEKKKVMKHGGQVYEFSPYALLWNNDSYYALGYSKSHDKVVKFRVDRMALPEMTELPVVPKPKSFRVEAYAKTVFQMYDDEVRDVTLRCENGLMNSIIDRFGENVKTTLVDDEHFSADVKVSVSPTFFGWVVGFNGRVQIAAPTDVKTQFAELLRRIAGDTF